MGRFSSLALTGDDFPVIGYSDLTNKNLRVAVCNDIVCSTPTLLTVDHNGDFGEYASLALSSNGYPLVSYYDATLGNFDLKLARFKPPPKPVDLPPDPDSDPVWAI